MEPLLSPLFCTLSLQFCFNKVAYKCLDMWNDVEDAKLESGPTQYDSCVCELVY